jgi:GR25 family glycosyltransferase involved in LPS biosynthesis
MEPDYNKLLLPYAKIQYYKTRDIQHLENSILVYYDADILNYTLIRNSIEKNVPVILVLKNLNDSTELALLQNAMITVICHRLRDYQQLLSYKTEDKLFIYHGGLEIAKRVILLLRDVKRVEHVETHVKPKLKAMKIFPAIDAMTPDAIDNFVQEYHIPILQPIRAGKIGCAFSHISVWRELLQSLNPSYMILEDDVQPSIDYNDLMIPVLKELPVTFDILFLYVSPKFYRNDDTIQLPGKNYINKGYYTEDVSAYIISRKGARKLLRKFKAIKEPLDIMITKEIMNDEIEAYTTKKMLFENIGQKTATQENILESNTYDSKIYAPE